MISALLYLQVVSIKNRLLVRLKRLKQPKYLVGGIVGGIYFYFYFIRYIFGFGRPQPAMPLAGSSETLALYEGIGAALLMLLVVLNWLLPRERAALAFTEAEVTFLFPAPISRRGLIHYKLLRSQVAILFTSLFLVLLSNRLGGKAWIHAVGWWLILSTLNLHLLGASFARTMLLDRGITHWQRRTAILLFLTVMAGAVGIWARNTLPAIHISELDSPGRLMDCARQLLTAGPVPWLLYPFRLVVRPYLAQTTLEFAIAFVPAVGLLALNYVWVIRSDVAFEEASVEASRKLAEKVAAVRSGNWQVTNKSRQRRRAPFVLRPPGSAAVALLWKNLISAGQAFTWRMWLLLGVIGISTAIAMGHSAHFKSLASVLGILAGMFLLWSLMLGPQVLRQDFRQDLAMAGVLKSFPLRGWQIALGELLAPAVILSGIQWGLILAGGLLLSGAPVPGVNQGVVAAGSLGLGVVLPVLNLLILQIPNAAVLLFPAWFQPGKDAAQGIEATGQRIIFMLGQLVALLVAMIPAAAVGLAVFITLRVVLGMPAAILVASAASALVLALEAVLGMVLLGRLFERLDLSTEELS